MADPEPAEAQPAEQELSEGAAEVAGAVEAPTGRGGPGFVRKTKQQKKQERFARKAESIRQKKEAKKELKRVETAAKLEERERRREQLPPEERERQQELCRAAREAAKEAERAAQAAWRAEFESGPEVTIDCDFGSYMLEKEVKSCASQMSFCWGSIKRAKRPVHLSICGLIEGSAVKEQLMKKPGVDKWGLELLPQPFYEHPAARGSKANIVYLTADSPNIIEDLEEGKVYVIGGLVDHNRHKCLTLKRAEEHGVSHAALPLKKVIDVSTSGKFTKVLTINHMVDLFNVFRETKDWAEAVRRAVPARKEVKMTQGGEGEGEGAAEGEGGEEGSAEAAPAAPAPDTAPEDGEPPEKRQKT